jgi:hypothetical protein
MAAKLGHRNFSFTTLYYLMSTEAYFVHWTAGTHMVFFILNVAGGLGVILMFTPFLTEKKKTPSEPL